MLLVVMGAGSLCPVVAERVCTPNFPLQAGAEAGWLGADAAYSIPLPDGRDLWIFGDTLYGTKRVVQGNIPVMVRNSIGVSTCGRDGQFHIEYAIRRNSDGKPNDFFEAQHPNTWYWALDGFRAGNDVWVTLLCVRATGSQSVMGFETCGSDLARISNPGSVPQKWSVHYFPLVADGAHAYPSATTVTDGDYADLFALYEKGSRPLIAARIALRRLGDPQRNLEYLARDGKWKQGLNPEDAKAVMTEGSAELSIRYHPELKKWVAIMFAPGGFSRNIILRSAPAATGPWTDGEVIYSVSEMTPGKPDYDKDTFCYAGKEHPEFEHGDLVVTYVCNTFAVPKLEKELNIYFPRTLRLPMPQMQAHDKHSDAGR